ncbi:type II secretion system F family protein [Tessaracoccus sp. G1721]
MTPFTIAAVAALSLGIGALAWLLVAGTDPVRARALDSLNRGAALPADARPRHQQGHLRAGQLIDTPVRRGRLERAIAKAGFPGGWTVDQILSIKVLGALLAGILMFLLWMGSRSLLMALFGIAVTVGIYFLPDLLLVNAYQKRREAVDLELADTLDQMSIAVQAGLGFDAAMLRVARNGTGILSQELVRTMQDIQVGQSRRNAYEDLAERTGSIPLRRFVRTVIQAETYGIPLADVLNAQADEMRVTRRQRAERKAMEIPVKVVFPLILCILPVLFIVILGPAAITIMENLLPALG